MTKTYKNNAVVSLLPVDGGGNFVVVGELKRIQYTKDLIKVAACRCGASEGVKRFKSHYGTD